MRFFLDHNVPLSVRDVFEKAGHEVIVQRDVIPPDSSDPIVALTSALNDAVLVSFDRDHNALAHRHGVSHRRLRLLSRIHLRCEFPQAARRISEALSLIEHEWIVAQGSSDKRMFVEILGHGIKSLR